MTEVGDHCIICGYEYQWGDVSTAHITSKHPHVITTILINMLGPEFMKQINEYIVKNLDETWPKKWPHMYDYEPTY